MNHEQMWIGAESVALFLFPNLTELHRMRHDAEKKARLNILFTRRQRDEPESPKQRDTPSRAQSRSTEEAENSYNDGMRIYDMKLPLELWREVIREAGTIQDEFECPTLHNDMAGESPNRLYLILWNKAFQTRLSLALVSRSWHSIALQYLYSSLVVKRDDNGTFARKVAMLATANLARWVQRVTLLGVLETTELRRTLEYLPNLRFCDIGNNYYPIFNLPSMCCHLISLENVVLCTEMVEALSGLPNLQYLRCIIPKFIRIDRLVILPRLHTLHIVASSIEPWSQFLMMPNLRTLRIADQYLPSSVWQAALGAHLPTLHTFASDNQSSFAGFPTPPPAVPLPAPRLRELLIKEPISTLIHIPSHISLASLEVIHLPLEREILQGIVPKSQFAVSVQWEQRTMDTLSMALWVTRYPSITPKLHTVCTDLTSNALTLAGPLVREYLEDWLEVLDARNVQVTTRVYETIWSDAKQMSLARVLNATPNFAFWPPCLPHNEDFDRWEKLAYATGRHLMKWKVKSDGIECEWLESDP